MRRISFLFSLTIAFLTGFLPFTVMGWKAPVDGIKTHDPVIEISEPGGLFQEAQKEGRIRVLVELKLPFSPEGKLHSQMAIQQQRFGIQNAQQKIIQSLKLSPDQLVRRFKYVPQMVIEVDPSQFLALMLDPRVQSIHEDRLVGLDLSLSVPHIGADLAWDLGYRGEGQVVVVLDSGVDADHEFLNGKVLSEACYSNSGGEGEGTSLCPNGQPVQIGTGAAIHCPVAIPGCEHGTHVAGIAVGKGETFSGVAPEADLIAIQVFTQFVDPVCWNYGQPNSPCIMTYLYSDLLAGLERVYELRDSFHIAAVNLSLGGGYYDSECVSDPLNAIISTLRSVEIATIVASGNSGFNDAIGSPACVPAAISVASIDLDDDVSSFSDVASFLDFYAPGDWIYSSMPDDTYGFIQGTSMAAPHVAGAWAVIKSKVPYAGVDFVYQVLSKTGIPVDDQRSGGSVKAIPRIQLDDAIDTITLLIYPVVRNQTPP